MGFSYLYSQRIGISYLDSFNKAFESDVYSGKNAHMQEDYDMLIISSKKFRKIAERLIKHKESHGIRCKLVVPQEIYRMITKGRDYAEKIKIFIREEFDRYSIRYVLLFGGIDFIPSRYCHIPTRYPRAPLPTIELVEEKFVSDLYYADLYDEKGTFSSWDTNNDGIFAEWRGKTAEDKSLDLRPDIAIGRIPCQSLWEATSVVNKIISYESKSNFRDKWFKTVISVAGDTYPENEIPDGEVDAKNAINYLTGFKRINLWYSEGSLYSRWGIEVIKAINSGSGFLVFFGHGNVPFWATHPYRQEKLISIITLYHIQLLSNKHKLPVCFAPGCKNSAFDLRFKNLFASPICSFYKMDYFSKCWSWMWLRKREGGCIATIGSTGVGFVRQDRELDGEGGWSYMGELFFKNYREGLTVVGDLWKKCIWDYLEKYTIDWDTPSLVYGGKEPKPDVVHAKTVESFTLLGDPSLRIGGYEKQEED